MTGPFDFVFNDADNARRRLYHLPCVGDVIPAFDERKEYGTVNQMHHMGSYRGVYCIWHSETGEIEWVAPEIALHYAMPTHVVFANFGTLCFGIRDGNWEIWDDNSKEAVWSLGGQFKDLIGMLAALEYERLNGLPPYGYLATRAR